MSLFTLARIMRLPILPDVSVTIKLLLGVLAFYALTFWLRIRFSSSILAVTTHSTLLSTKLELLIRHLRLLLNSYQWNPCWALIAEVDMPQYVLEMRFLRICSDIVLFNTLYIPPSMIGISSPSFGEVKLSSDVRGVDPTEPGISRFGGSSGSMKYLRTWYKNF